MSRLLIRGDPTIPRGLPMAFIGPDELYCEVHYFKYGAAPVYLVRYMVENTAPRWSCTCPDFIYRRAASGKMCKHCQGCVIFKTLMPTVFVQNHINQITQDNYNKMRVTPIGEPLSVFGQQVYIRVEICGEPGYIGYIANVWRCYTCGGSRGIRFLKGKQCKHIACYSYSLIHNDYEQYCHNMEQTRFVTACNRQRRSGRTHWQRFTL